jgi:uncharacterized membrane protein
VNESRLAFFIYFLILALGILNCLHAYPQLPQLLASHFSANGTPNGWLPKNTFFLLTAIMMAISALPGFLAPRSIASQPDSRLNLPKKSYWLAPERRAETLGFIKTQMTWFSCGILFVLLYGTSQAINANLPSVGSFNARGMFYVMVGFVAMTLFWMVRFVRHFYNAPDSTAISAPPRS